MVIFWFDLGYVVQNSVNWISYMISNTPYIDFFYCSWWRMHEFWSISDGKVSFESLEKFYLTVIINNLNCELKLNCVLHVKHTRSKILIGFMELILVRFVYESFKKLRPGIPLKCLHGRMKQVKECSYCNKDQFFFQLRCLQWAWISTKGSIGLFSFSMHCFGVDCPDDVANYIHRVGPTARYDSKGRSVLFLLPFEMKMLERLQEKKILVEFDKPNTK
ncbi:putative RNA helicase [Helianthus anomalus]